MNQNESGGARLTIAILLAVYEPRMDWLREQLVSLNDQTYPALRLYIRDDASEQVSFRDIRALVEECVTAFPCIVSRNKTNLGSNRTFELLTAEAEGDLFAYCDQDDIWVPEKLAVLERRMNGAVMAYSDMAVIDGNGTRIADSLREVRPRLRYLSGDGLADSYFFRNCTAGCSMLVRSKAARAAVPFPRSTVWDQWVAIAAAARGTVAFAEEKLVLYRQHGHNQTGILTNVRTKEDYRRERLEPLRERLEAYEKAGTPSEGVKRFVHARLEHKPLAIWRYRRYSPYEAILEAAAGCLPEKLFEKAMKRARGAGAEEAEEC